MLKYLIILTLCLYSYLSFKNNNLNKNFYITCLCTIFVLIFLKKKPKININNKKETRIDKKLLYKPFSNKKSPEELYYNFIDNLDRCGIFNSEDIPIILFKICVDVGYIFLKNNLYYIDNSKFNKLNMRIIEILNNDLSNNKIPVFYPQCILDNLQFYLNNLQEFLDLFNNEIIGNYNNLYKELPNTNKYYFYYYIEPEVVDIESEEIIENFSNKNLSFSLRFK